MLSSDESSCIVISSDVSNVEEILAVSDEEEIISESDISTNDINSETPKHGNISRIITLCNKVREQGASRSGVSQSDFGEQTTSKANISVENADDKQPGGDKLEKIVLFSSDVHRNEKEIESECGNFVDSVCREPGDDISKEIEIKFTNDGISSPEKDADTSISMENIEHYESLLDSVYGKAWRSNRKKIFSKTEPVNRIRREKTNPTKTCVKNLFNHQKITTEVKQFSSSSKKLSWRTALKNVCDSDTSSDESPHTPCGDYRRPVSKQTRACRRNLFNCSEIQTESEETSVGSTLPCTGVSKNSCESDTSDDESFQLDDAKAKLTLETLDDDIQRCNEKFIERTESELKHSPEKYLAERKFLAGLSAAASNDMQNPLANFYRKCYKTSKEELVDKLYKLYNEAIFDNLLPADMKIEWKSRLTKTAGRTNNRLKRNDGKTEFCSSIDLSAKVLNSPGKLRDTLLHEMCHSANWVIDNLKNVGHGPQWRMWTNKALQIFPELPPVKTCHNYDIKTKYTYKCTKCQQSVDRHSKSLDVKKTKCGYCFGHFELLINKTTKDGVKSVPVTPRQNLNGFALFVKENYSSVKKKQHTHGDVMKILGQQFSQLKMESN